MSDCKEKASVHHDDRLDLLDGSTVACRITAPPNPRCALTLAHGAGAGMTHPHLERLCEQLAKRGVATLRFQFPYMEAGLRRPDPPRLLQGAVRAAVEETSRRFPSQRTFAGGRSLGARMTAYAEADDPLPVAGLVYFAFPLHRPLRVADPDPTTLERWLPMVKITKPQLFLQGDRDTLARLPMLRTALATLESSPALHVVPGADHSFVTTKATGRTLEDVEQELAEVAVRWMGHGDCPAAPA